MYRWQPKEVSLIDEKRISDCKGICNEAKRMRMAAPTAGVPLKSMKTTYLKKWGLEKYRRPPVPKPLINQLESIDLESLDDAPKSQKWKKSIAHVIEKTPREPLATTAQIKALKRKHKLEEEIDAKRLKRQRVTAALRRQGIKAVYKQEFGDKRLTAVTSKNGKLDGSDVVQNRLLKAGNKRKL